MIGSVPPGGIVADRGPTREAMVARIKQGIPTDFETQVVRPDGTVIDLAGTVSPVRDESGAVIGTSSIARDVTEEKRAAEAVRALSARLRRSENGSRAWGGWPAALRTTSTTCSASCRSMPRSPAADRRPATTGGDRAHSGSR